uniref:Prostamide/prostaglandin F synthase n=1 Tax=Schistocephalus solidus TaxID=70667 RepID=A0A0X3P2E1_SCHSO
MPIRRTPRESSAAWKRLTSSASSRQNCHPNLRKRRSTHGFSCQKELTATFEAWLDAACTIQAPNFAIEVIDMNCTTEYNDQKIVETYALPVPIEFARFFL